MTHESFPAPQVEMTSSDACWHFPAYLGLSQTFSSLSLSHDCHWLIKPSANEPGLRQDCSSKAGFYPVYAGPPSLPGLLGSAPRARTLEETIRRGRPPEDLVAQALGPHLGLKAKLAWLRLQAQPGQRGAGLKVTASTKPPPRSSMTHTGVGTRGSQPGPPFPPSKTTLQAPWPP